MFLIQPIYYVKLLGKSHPQRSCKERFYKTRVLITAVLLIYTWHKVISYKKITSVVFSYNLFGKTSKFLGEAECS